MNKVVLWGRLVGEPELKSSNAVCLMTIEVREKRKGGGGVHDYFDRHRVVATGGLAMECARSLKPGDSILIDGKLQTHVFKTADGRDGKAFEVFAHRVTLTDQPRSQERRSHGIEDYPELPDPIFKCEGGASVDE